MRAAVSSLRIFGWVALVVVVLLPRTALADHLVAADFDGDGKRDFASVDRPLSPGVRVWLSSTRKSRLLTSERPLLDLAARDLDGDGRDELIAFDGSPTLQIWKASHHKKFARYPARRLLACSRSEPARAPDNGICGSGSSETSDDKASPLVVLAAVFNPVEVETPRHPSITRAASIRRSSRTAPRAPPSA